MTQPIQMFENLTSETSPAGGNDIAKTTLTSRSAESLNCVRDTPAPRWSPTAWPTP